jgi:hypothetical protein
VPWPGKQTTLHRIAEYTLSRTPRPIPQPLKPQPRRRPYHNPSPHSSLCLFGGAGTAFARFRRNVPGFPAGLRAGSVAAGEDLFLGRAGRGGSLTRLGRTTRVVSMAGQWEMCWCEDGVFGF